MLCAAMRRKVALAFSILLLSWWSAADGQERSKSEILSTVYFNNINMAAVLHSFAADYDVTIGLETDLEKPQSQITLNLHEVNFRQILDGIVQAEPRYRWRESNGSIDVVPINGGTGLLDFRIETFQLKDVNRVLAANRLFSLPEIRTVLLAKGLRPGPLNPPSDRIKDEKLSFDLRGVTLRQALNQIAHDSGANFWVFRTYPDHTFEVNFSCCPS
jgi:hypothetical protein